MSVILGLEISDHFIRGTLIQNSFRKNEVLQYLEISISDLEAISSNDHESESFDAEGALQDPSVLALKEFADKLVRFPDITVASIRGEKSLLHRFSIPKGAMKRAGEILPFELETKLPFELNEVIFDFQLIGTDDSFAHVLTATAEKKILKECVSKFDRAGLTLKELVPETVALDGVIDLLKKENQKLLSEEPFFVLDMKQDHSVLTFFDRDSCCFARSIGFGSAQLQEGKQDKVEQEFRRTLLSYRAQGGKDVSGGFVCGEASDWPDFVAWVEQLFLPEEASVETLSMSMSSVSGVKKIELPKPEVAELGANRLNFVLSAALAFRFVRKGKQINLLKGDLAPKKTQGVLQTNAKVFGASAILVFFAFVFSSYASISTLNARNAELKERLAKTTKDLFGEEARSVFNARELMAGLGVQKDPLPRFDAYDILEVISGRIPPEIVHDTKRLHIDFEDETAEGRFDLQGTVQSIAERDTIAQALESHPCFLELKKGRTTPASGGEKLNYKLEAEIKCESLEWPSNNAVDITETSSQETGASK